MQGAFEVESRQVLNDMPRARQEDRTEAYEEKQLAPETGKQVCPDAGKQIFADDVGLEASANEDQSAPYADNDHNAAIRPSRKIRVVLCGILALIIILAIILGLALGLKHNSSEKEPLTNSTTSSSTSLPSSPTTILNKPFQRNVAALSFASNDISSQLVNITHVYFQDNLGRLLEASGSADNASWVISATPMTAKNGSAIAAAVSRPGFPQEFGVFYLNDSNIIHDMTYTESGARWLPGTISSQGYTAFPNSSIAVMYDQCRNCSNNTIIAFQHENGAVAIGNHTLKGWTLTQLDAALDPILGTGLALHPFYRTEMEDQINLYHQKSDLTLCLASSLPATSHGAAKWSLSTQVYGTIPFGSKVAAATSYSNLSNGYATWVELLSISETGIQVGTWSGAINDWLQHSAHPKTMTNLSSNGNSYESVAVTATGSAFGAVMQDGKLDRIESWQVNDDMIDWTRVGNVDIGNAWV